MRFKKYLKEIKWQRRQLRKGKPYWVYDKYEITKEPDGTFKMVDISQMTGNKPKEIGTFDSLKKAKESINEYSGGTPVSQVMYGAYGGELRRAAKTGHSRDYTGSSGKNISGNYFYEGTYDIVEGVGCMPPVNNLRKIRIKLFSNGCRMHAQAAVRSLALALLTQMQSARPFNG